MRRRDHPSFPSEITCCFLSVLKTLLMPSEPIRALSGVNVPGFPMAGFQLTLYGRIWATPEGKISENNYVWRKLPSKGRMGLVRPGQNPNLQKASVKLAGDICLAKRWRWNCGESQRSHSIPVS